MSIRLRLTVWYTAMLTILAACFAVVVYVAIDRQLAEELHHAAELRAIEVSQQIVARQIGWRLRQVDPVRLPPPSALDDQRHPYQVVDSAGRVLHRSGDLAGPLLVSDSALEILRDGQVTRDTLVMPDGSRVALYGAPLLQHDQVVGAILVATPLAPLEATLARVRLVLIAAVLGAVMVAGVVGWALASAAMRPVDQITRTARTIGRSGDLSVRLPAPSRQDELGRLTAAFNELLGRLDEALATQRRFLADASHELRTPLTTIRLNAEALLRAADRESEERLTTANGRPDDEAVRSIARESARMGRLVTDLLVLARADDGQPPLRRPFMLDALLVEVYQQARRHAHGLRLEIGELEQVEVVGDPDQLKQVVLNLTENACRYTPEGGRVTLDLVERGGAARLSVQDTGIGIATDDLPRIFQRFYRVDAARSRQAGGTGLGLAIGRAIAEAHGGRIEVTSRLGHGSTFTLVLPTRQAPDRNGAGTPSDAAGKTCHPGPSVLTAV